MYTQTGTDTQVQKPMNLGVFCKKLLRVFNINCEPMKTSFVFSMEEHHLVALINNRYARLYRYRDYRVTEH